MLLYAQAEAEYHEMQAWCEEILITRMAISATDGLEDRISVLEKKMRDMEPLVKGLIAELLDIKAFASTVSREAAERSRQEQKQTPVVRAAPASPPAAAPAGGTTVIRPRAAAAPEVPAEPEMVRIMQTDGTMKMEPRYGGAIDNSSVGYGRTKKGTFKGNQAPLIYAADKEKPDKK